MKTMVKLLVVLALVLAGFSQHTTASASHGFSVTIDKRATLTASHILVEVSGTYSCGQPAGGLDPDKSGFGYSVTQFYKGEVISGGGGIGGFELNCNGATHTWTQQISGWLPNGQPALWHGGKAIVQGGGEVCNSDRSDCAGVGFTLAIRIRG